MIKPRKSYQGQCVIEYVVLFAVVAALSIGLFIGIPGKTIGVKGMFSNYVVDATQLMK